MMTQVEALPRSLKSYMEQVLAAFDEMTAHFEEKHPEPKGQLRLSVPVVFGRLCVVPAIAEFLVRYPQVGVDLVFNDRYVDLVEEAVDLALRVGVPANTSGVLQLAERRLGIALLADWLVASSKGASDDDARIAGPLGRRARSFIDHSLGLKFCMTVRV